MADVFKITIIFIVILLLLRRKINIGYVLMIASGLVFIFYLVPVSGVVETVKKTSINQVTIKLLLSLSLIRVFEIVLREHNILTAMMLSVKSYIRSRKAIIISMPLLIGMLPSLGGAYFSAPMVNEATEGLEMSQEEKAFINYWFRHPWEYVLPLYPGILLAAIVSNIPLYTFIGANLLYAVMQMFTGFIFSMRKIEKRISTHLFNPKENNKHTITQALMSFIPVISVLIFVMLFRIELHYALLFVTMPLVLFYKYGFRDIIRILRHGFAVEVLVMIFGIMLFKEAMEYSGAVKNLSRFFIEQGIPVFPIICLLPFISGILTGVTVGFVGSTFPLLISISGGASLADMSLAFAAGFAGVLISPVHLCLILTREYFKADVLGVYRKIIPACAVILVAAFIEHFVLSSKLI